MNAIITFTDGGQDFTEWRVEKDKVVDCQPFQFSVWGGALILNADDLTVGGLVKIKGKVGIGIMEIRHPIEKLQILPDAFGYDVEIELNAGGAGTEIVHKHWRATSYAAVIRRAKLVKRAKRVVKVTPLSEEAYCRAYGDPRIKSRFN